MNFKYFIFVCLCFMTSCAAIRSIMPFMAEVAVEVEDEVEEEIAEVEKTEKVAPTSTTKEKAKTTKKAK